MAANEPTTRRMSTTGVLVYFLVTIMFATVGTIAGIRLITVWPALMGGAVQPTAAPTAYVVPTQPARLPISDPAPLVLPGIAQNEATAQTLFDAAVQAGEPAAPVENVGQGDAPAVISERPADERQPSGENVPTAEPIVTSMFGSNSADPPVNVQETQQCKHGQVWVDGKGCKNHP